MTWNIQNIPNNTGIWSACKCAQRWCKYRFCLLRSSTLCCWYESQSFDLWDSGGKERPLDWFAMIFYFFKSRREETPCCSTTWQPRHRDQWGLYRLVMRSQQARNQPLNVLWPAQTWQGSPLQLSCILPIYSLGARAGINDAIMDSGKPRIILPLSVML